MQSKAPAVFVVERSAVTRDRVAQALRTAGCEVSELEDGVHLLSAALGQSLRGKPHDSMAVVATADESVLEVLELLRSACWSTRVVLIGAETLRDRARGLGATLIDDPDASPAQITTALWKSIGEPQMTRGAEPPLGDLRRKPPASTSQIPPPAFRRGTRVGR